MRSLLGTWPTTQACALTGDWTGDPLVCKPALNPLSRTSPGPSLLFLVFNISSVWPVISLSRKLCVFPILWEFLAFFIFIFYFYSVTIVCIFSPSLHPTPASPTSLPHLYPPLWFCPCVPYSSFYYTFLAPDGSRSFSMDFWSLLVADSVWNPNLGDMCLLLLHVRVSGFFQWTCTLEFVLILAIKIQWHMVLTLPFYFSENPGSKEHLNIYSFFPISQYTQNSFRIIPSILLATTTY